MSSELSIEITGLRLFGAHGLYYEEALVENEFEINVILSFHPTEQITELDQTLDYVIAIQVIGKEFEKPTKLLETLAIRIALKLKDTFNSISGQDIHIVKLHAPITSFTGDVGVRYRQNY